MVDLVNTVVAQEKGHRCCNDILVFRIAERAPHQHVDAIADIAGDHGVGQRMPAQVGESGIDAGSQVGAGIDKRPVEVEGDEPQ